MGEKSCRTADQEIKYRDIRTLHKTESNPRVKERSQTAPKQHGFQNQDHSAQVPTKKPDQKRSKHRRAHGTSRLQTGHDSNKVRQ